jgi:hypothetical protein
VLDKIFAGSDLPLAAAAMKPLAYRNLHVQVGFQWTGVGQWRRAFESFGRAMRTSGKPLSTAGRIAFFLLANHVVRRTRAGRNLLRWQSELRRLLRERNQWR